VLLALSLRGRARGTTGDLDAGVSARKAAVHLLGWTNGAGGFAGILLHTLAGGRLIALTGALIAGVTLNALAGTVDAVAGKGCAAWASALRTQRAIRVLNWGRAPAAVVDTGACGASQVLRAVASAFREEAD
jgi:hypothetical protein